MTLNLNDIVSPALDFLNPPIEMTFTKTTTTWNPSSPNPTIVEEEEKVKGKIQPASSQDLEQLGFNLTEFQYYKIFVSYPATQLDKLRQLGSDTFTARGIEYRIVGKIDWNISGWVEAFCYIDKVN